MDLFWLGNNFLFFLPSHIILHIILNGNPNFNIVDIQHFCRSLHAKQVLEGTAILSESHWWSTILEYVCSFLCLFFSSKMTKSFVWDVMSMHYTIIRWSLCHTQYNCSNEIRGRTICKEWDFCMPSSWMRSISMVFTKLCDKQQWIFFFWSNPNINTLDRKSDRWNAQNFKQFFSF